MSGAGGNNLFISFDVLIEEEVGESSVNFFDISFSFKGIICLVARLSLRLKILLQFLNFGFFLGVLRL